MFDLVLGVFMKKLDEALFSAIEDRDVDAVKQLLEDGADVNARGGNQGMTALMCAIALRDVKMVETLLATEEIDIEALDESGWNAFRYAGTFGCDKIVRMLIDAGADVNYVTQSDGGTALMCVILRTGPTRTEGDDEEIEKIVQILLDEGADITARDKHGTTALRLAVHYDKIEIVKMLLANGVRLEDVINCRKIKIIEPEIREILERELALAWVASRVCGREEIQLEKNLLMRCDDFIKEEVEFLTMMRSQLFLCVIQKTFRLGEALGEKPEGKDLLIQLRNLYEEVLQLAKLGEMGGLCAKEAKRFELHNFYEAMEKRESCPFSGFSDFFSGSDGVKTLTEIRGKLDEILESRLISLKDALFALCFIMRGPQGIMKNLGINLEEEVIIAALKDFNEKIAKDDAERKLDLLELLDVGISRKSSVFAPPDEDYSPRFSDSSSRGWVRS